MNDAQKKQASDGYTAYSNEAPLYHQKISHSINRKRFDVASILEYRSGRLSFHLGIRADENIIRTQKEKK
jgi:hypothetical protein